MDRLVDGSFEYNVGINMEEAQRHPMKDIPQPSRDPYSVGDRVRIYIGSDDTDSRFHGIVCEIIEVLRDDLDAETGRSTDAYSYILQDIESNEELSISFRHQDLVPVRDNQ